MRLLPRQEEFFDLFVEVAKRNTESARLLADMFAADLDRRTYFVDAIKRLEHEADQVTHEVVSRLDRTFITPLDGEDIHGLATDLDDVLDIIDGTARRAEIFRLGKAPDGAKRLAEIIHKATQALERGREGRGDQWCDHASGPPGRGTPLTKSTSAPTCFRPASIAWYGTNCSPKGPSRAPTS